MGTVHDTGDGRCALRFERHLPHPIEKVWRAITDPAQLRAWFPAVVEFDLTPGAKLRFDPTSEQVRRLGLPADEPIGAGEITSVDPPRLLEYTWNDEVLRWELGEDGPGACRLVFVNTITDRSAAATLAGGWHAGLDVVEAQLAGEEITWSPWDRATEIGTGYARALG